MLVLLRIDWLIIYCRLIIVKFVANHSIMYGTIGQDCTM